METDAQFIHRMNRVRFDEKVRRCLESKYRIPVVAFYESQLESDWSSWSMIFEETATPEDWMRWRSLHPDLKWNVDIIRASD